MIDLVITHQNGQNDHFQAWSPRVASGRQGSPRVSKVPGGPQGWVRWVITRSIIFKSFSYTIFKIGQFPHWNPGKNIVYHFPNKISKNLLRIWLTRNLLVKPLTRVTIPSPDQPPWSFLDTSLLQYRKENLQVHAWNNYNISICEKLGFGMHFLLYGLWSHDRSWKMFNGPLQSALAL